MKHLFFTTVVNQIAAQMGDLVVWLGSAANLMAQQSDGLATNLGLRAIPNDGFESRLTTALAFNDHHGTTSLGYSWQLGIRRMGASLPSVALWLGFGLGQRLGQPHVLLH